VVVLQGIAYRHYIGHIVVRKKRILYLYEAVTPYTSSNMLIVTHDAIKSVPVQFKGAWAISLSSDDVIDYSRITRTN
jgi:hypothetical protein